MSDAAQERRQLPVQLPADVPLQLTKEYEIDQSGWLVLTKQIFPGATSVDTIRLALALCKKNNYDPFKKPYHIVKVYDQGKEREDVWPGINSLLITAHRTGEFDGIDEVVFGEEFKYGGLMVPRSAKVTVHRKRRDGSRAPFTAEVFFTECAVTKKDGSLNKMWRTRPRGQMGKCVTAAALRLAFPEELGGTYCSEEMDGQSIGDEPTMKQEINQRIADKKQAAVEDVTPKSLSEEIHQDRKERAEVKLEVAQERGDEVAAEQAKKELEEVKGIAAPKQIEVMKAAGANGWPPAKTINQIAELCKLPDNQKALWSKNITDAQQKELVEFFTSTPYVEDVEEA